MGILLTLGIAAILTALSVEGIKKLAPTWSDKKEPMLAYALAVIYFVTTKLAGQHSDFGWLDITVASIFTGYWANDLHDKFVNVMFKKAQ